MNAQSDLSLVKEFESLIFFLVLQTANIICLLSLEWSKIRSLSLPKAEERLLLLEFSTARNQAPFDMPLFTVTLLFYMYFLLHLVASREDGLGVQKRAMGGYHTAVTGYCTSTLNSFLFERVFH